MSLHQQLTDSVQLNWPKSKVVVVGSSGHAKVVVDIIEKSGQYTIVGFIDSFKSVGDIEFGYSVLGHEDDLELLVNEHHLHGYIVAIGDNYLRSQMYRKIALLTANRLLRINAIHPHACISRTVSIGLGNVIMAGVVINAGCVIGNQTVINTKASLDHDSILEDGSSLAPNATVGGNCHIGCESAIGISATLIHRVNVGEQSVVGAGSIVIKNVDSYSVVYGNPAKFIRHREVGEKYF